MLKREVKQQREEKLFAVTGDVKKGSKSAKRRKSFCARMCGMKRRRTGAATARDKNSRINQSLRRWRCRC